MAATAPHLAGKRVVVTGASRGLGRAIAVACAREGADLVVNGRDRNVLAETVRLVEAKGARVEAVPGSVADESTCESIIRRCVDTFGAVDCLVNNAGITRDRTLVKMTSSEFDEVIAVNLRGTWACTKAAAAVMRETGGSIVNVVSNSAFQGTVGQTNYVAAKAGIAGMTRTWTNELGRYGIRVNAVWPLALTDMTQGLVDHLQRKAKEEGSPLPTAESIGLGEPERVAEIFVFLASDHALGITGQIITFNGKKIALWTHPREVNVVERDAWTLESIVRDFKSTVGSPLQKLYTAI